MTNRRSFLTGGVGSTPMSGNGANMNHVVSNSENKGAVPDIGLITHEGTVAKLYSDLIQDRVVTLNFMSIERESTFPVSHRLAEMAVLLGDKLGRDVFMISISTDPDHDTTERLAAFHREMGGHAGWTFARSPMPWAELVAQRFYPHGRDISLGGRTDIVQYGYAKVGLWAAFPWDIKPRDAAERVTWVMPRQAQLDGELRRAGPRRLVDDGQSWNNRSA